MRKKLIILLTVILSLALFGCTDENYIDPNKKTVAVSIVPQEAFVEAIAGDLVNVITLIPAGQSPATYSPGVKTMATLQKADVYFAIGVPTEGTNIFPELGDINKINLHDIVDAVYAPLTISETSRDPHIWLSIKRVKVMVEAIADELSRIDPDNSETYQDNKDAYLLLLDSVDEQITEMFEDKTELRTFIIYHPSFAYFAEDYNLTMVSIEEDGKVASLSGLISVVDFAVDNEINRVYYQSEFDVSQVESLTEEIEGFQVVELIPLSSEYLENMLVMASRIAEGLR